MNQCRFLTSEGYKGVSVIATILGGVHYYDNYFGMQVVLSMLPSEVASERQFSFRITRVHTHSSLGKSELLRHTSPCR